MKLIDLDEFLRQNCIDRIEGKSCEECKHHVLEVSCERLMEHPTVDAVEVVRCGECKYHMDIDDGRQKHRMCAQLGCDDWFCADGRRRG